MLLYDGTNIILGLAKTNRKQMVDSDWRTHASEEQIAFNLLTWLL